MPRFLSYLLVIGAGLAAGFALARGLWMNQIAAVLGLYGAGLLLFLLGVDALLSQEGFRGFLRDAGEGGRHMAGLLVSLLGSTVFWVSFELIWHVPRHFGKLGPLLIIPLGMLVAVFAVLVGFEFWAAGGQWWRKTRTQLMEGWRGRIGLLAAAALPSVVIISIITWQYQLIAVALIGLAVWVLYLLVDFLLPRSQIWAVARQTVAEAFHYKLVVAWVLVILLLIFALPPAISGDGLTLKSRVQSYLEVTLNIIGLGLGLLTVGLSAYTLPNEISKKLVFMTTSKPIARWQIFAGKWVGIGVLNAGLLLFSGAAVWGFTWYLKSQPTTEEDRTALEQEVLKVRHGIPLEEPADLGARVDEYVNRLVASGDIREDSVPAIRESKFEELQRTWRSLKPQDDQVYVFRNLMVNREEQGYIHIRMKADNSSGVDDLNFPICWQAGDPQDINTVTNLIYQGIPTRRSVTLIVPASAVSKDGTLQFHMQNLSKRDTIIFEGKDSFELLYGIGTFHWNLTRALAIIWCRLAFVSALGLFFSTLLSFPVAVLATMLLFLVSLLSGFLTEALDAVAVRPDGTDPFWGALKLGYVLTPLGRTVVWSMPDFSKYDASGNVVDGRYVPALWVVMSFGFLVAFWCTALVGLGSLLLTRRELAREGA